MKAHVAALLCVMSFAGCSRAPDTGTVVGGSEDDFIEGGTVENVDRDKCEEYFLALEKVQSAKEEEKLLTEFAMWLNENGYKIRVEMKNGQHVLSCPYFPPITPWTEHSFLDVKNLELLPQYTPT
jgi:hypothetical protein